MRKAHGAGRGEPNLDCCPEKWQKVLDELGRKVQVNQKELFTYRELVATGGFRQDKLYVFLGSKLVLATALPAVFLFLRHLRCKIPRGIMILPVGCCAVAGFLLPTFFLSCLSGKEKSKFFIYCRTFSIC